MFTSRTRILAVTAVAATALIAAGCGSDDSGGSAAPSSSSAMADMPGMQHGSTPATATRTDFDDADVAFLTMMYPHHAQAVDMAKMVPSRSQNQQLITLAANVEKAQAPEMEQFAALLHSFGKPAPAATMNHPMNGVMTQDQMTQLQNATGADFDRMWLQMMIDHHQGAVEMANTELANGSNAEAKTLAQNIITAQQAEIQQMRGMLGQG
ncbi:hypothetical protein NONO_c65800 [Nocardia nova SH22a]|uniref:DUF305 domain-containing protein n=1 Tax=Nocardia nova SH22a TaxID=1415166 RepID=W5TPR9_9NOCA|nr:DUF305 domain-containing protein [Nocardia nova]AHH21350.1 hypothetical protein NONO_c65800 [Nocardia nova SH22a]